MTYLKARIFLVKITEMEKIGRSVLRKKIFRLEHKAHFKIQKDKEYVINHESKCRILKQQSAQMAATYT